MWELGYKASWALKNWCFWTEVLEKTLESPFNFKKIQPVYPKGNQSWAFIGRTDAEVETLILWPHDGKNLLIGNDPDSGKDWRWEEKGNDRGWDGWMASPTDGHEFEYALGVGEGQGSLACCSPWGHKELHMTEWMNWTEVKDLGIRLIPSRIYVSRITNCPWEIEMIRHPSIKMSGRNMPQESMGYCFAEFKRKTWTLSIYLVSHKHLCIIWF